jgi:ABC-type phosphate transport system ATPase subunit
LSDIYLILGGYDVYPPVVGSCLILRFFIFVSHSFLKLKEEYTVTIVTHILRQAKRLADCAVFLYCGELIEHSPAVEIFDNPKEEMTKEYIKGIIS